MNYFRTAKENAPTREERLRQLEEAKRQETAAAQAALKQPSTDDLPPKPISKDIPPASARPRPRKPPCL